MLDLSAPMGTSIQLVEKLDGRKLLVNKGDFSVCGVAELRF